MRSVRPPWRALTLSVLTLLAVQACRSQPQDTPRDDAGAETLTQREQWARNLADVREEHASHRGEFVWTSRRSPVVDLAYVQRLARDFGHGQPTPTTAYESFMSRLPEVTGHAELGSALVSYLRQETLTQEAYTPVGYALWGLVSLGTPTADAAIQATMARYAREREKVVFSPPRAGSWHPITAGAAAVKWQVLQWDRSDACWITRTGEHAWKQPLFTRIALRDRISAELVSADDRAIVLRTTDGRRVTVDFTRSRADTDSDGLSDLLEEYLGTDLSLPDTDGDGVSDGHDGNPLTPRILNPTDMMQIRSVAAFVHFAFEQKVRRPVRVVHTDGSALQEYVGYRGVLLPMTEASTQDWRVSINARRIGSTRVVVRFRWSVGQAVDHGQEVRVELIDGRWVVVEGWYSWVA